MVTVFFPMRKLRRKVKYLLIGAIVLIGAVAVYHQMVAGKARSSDIGINSDGSSWRFLLEEKVQDNLNPAPLKDWERWTKNFPQQSWKREYMGRANLHVFEDWCGSSTDDLRHNLHYPLYPHTRTTVSKLAVSPQWANYGLRIFGYLHPFADGDFIFALGSDDNSELWLSLDDSPLNLQLLAWVGKTGSEWTTPGEFDKYASQTSKSVWLSAQKRYFFEVIHKQNDRGTDHVEVAWQLLNKDFRFKIIESEHISLYTDESNLLISDVAHIPQTSASHQHANTNQRFAPAEMVREDPRDSFYQVHLINRKFLEGVLPDCSYKPSYLIKGFPLHRYEGLTFIHMSYVYPNDYTRLTHMETQDSCFYPERPYYMKMFGLSRYMTLNHPVTQEKKNQGKDSAIKRNKSILSEEEYDYLINKEKRRARAGQRKNILIPDYGDDYDDYIQKRRRKLFSLVPEKNASKLLNPPDVRREKRSVVQLQRNQIAVKQSGPGEKAEQIRPTIKFIKRQTAKPPARAGGMLLRLPVDTEPLKGKHLPAESLKQVGSRMGRIQSVYKLNQTQPPKDSQRQNLERDVPEPEVYERQKFIDRQQPSIKNLTISRRDDTSLLLRQHREDTDDVNSWRDTNTNLKMVQQEDLQNGNRIVEKNQRGETDFRRSDAEVKSDQMEKENYVYNAAEKIDERVGEDDSPWHFEDDFDILNEEDPAPKILFDTVVSWNQTFQVNFVDFQVLRSDWIDLKCNISGNLLLSPSDALPIVTAFMQQLNKKHNGRFTLVRVINVVKRVDGVTGSRYLLELELKDADGRQLRLSHYIYALIRQPHQSDNRLKHPKPQILLCNPVGFRWNPSATVHFIVPVKNQARWVQQLIVDMEWLFKKTGDANFNLIITDYQSTDMDVKKALEKSSLPSYKYVELSGNFERSAGLQAGIDQIDDDHSIVFLCDLHIHFPHSIIDTIRKHCVEGYMAFAPIVMRLDCGVTPMESRGYWEVNGFGLLAIYKSDLVAAGGMNTRDFTEQWGGEDWELLDRILQAGLEVDRIFLRNFLHHYHSKRGMWNRRMPRNHK